MHSAFEEFHAHIAGNRFLAFGDGGLKHFALRRKPESVVDQCGVFRNQAVAQVHHFAVHRDRFDRAVRMVQDGAAGGFVDAAVFHAGKTVFDNVDAADSVFATQRVELAHQSGR